MSASPRRDPRPASPRSRAARLVLAVALGALASSACDGEQAPPAGEAAPAAAGGPGAGPPVLRVDLLDNGSFAERDVEVAGGSGAGPIPWWRSANGLEQGEERDGVATLRTRWKEWAEQPVAGYAPLARGVALRGKLRGEGRVRLVDGSGASAELVLRSPDAWIAWELDGEDFAAQVGRPPAPRFLVRLEPADERSSASWAALECSVPLPCPSEQDLREEVLALARRVVAPWLARALDLEPPVATGFRCRDIDAISGEPIGAPFPSQFESLHGDLAEALRAVEVPEWREAHERFVASLLEHGFDPRTGLPRAWDTVADEPVADRPVEVALTFGFLLDVAREGPERFRARALERARALGDAVLAFGQPPDGGIAASYFPLDGSVNRGVNALRRLDVPAQLARLTAATSDPRYLAAASEALVALEFTHAWAGSWDAIDPAFDDDFGHYGARAATIALAAPGEATFARFADEGLAYFLPLWRDALRFGGNVAADQVRCWLVALDVARRERSFDGQVRPLLAAAARAHFKGEQYPGGAWGDVTHYRFDPRRVEVGDYSGAPSNLLHGLAALYLEGAGPPREELRAMYTAVLRSSVEHYLKPHGFLLVRNEKRGAPNSAQGTLRMLLGLRKMLVALSR